MDRVKELESMVMSNILSDVPVWTGNLSRHITAMGAGHIRISGPAYDKEVARNLVNKKGKGNVRRLSYSEWRYRSWTRPQAKKERIAITIKNQRGGTKQLFDYAWLLNEFGAFGTGRHQHWVNRAIYNACVMYIFTQGGGQIKFGGGFQPY